MTEYDFSPEAFEAHIHKQHQIARWVDRTNQAPQRNPFTPATPAVQALALANRYPEDDYVDGRSSHRRRESRDSRSDRHHDKKDRERDRDTRTRGDKESSSSSSRHPPPSSSSAARPQSRRHRSASHSASTVRPEPSRNYSVPQPLQLQNNYMSSSQQSSPTSITPQYPYPPKFVSPRDSKHSSRTSSTTRLPSPPSYFSQQPPHSAPVHQRNPMRSQTSPTHGYPADTKYGGYPAHQPSYPIKPIDLANAPQYPYSNYQTKPPPLIKRIFMHMGFAGGNKPPQAKIPRRKRSSSF